MIQSGGQLGCFAVGSAVPLRPDCVRGGPTGEERERIKALERENRASRQADEIQREAVDRSSA